MSDYEVVRRSVAERAESGEIEKQRANAQLEIGSLLSAGNGSRVGSALLIYADSAAFSVVGRVLQGLVASRRELEDAWLASGYASRIREVNLVRSAQAAGTSLAFREEISFADDTYFLPRRWAVFGLNCLAPQSIDWPWETDILESALLRGDVQDSMDWPAFSSQLPLMQFLSSTTPDQKAMELLAAYEPFRLLPTAWKDGSAFTKFLNQACEWHISQCIKSLKRAEYTYYSEPYTVLPTWLMAIKARREHEVGDLDGSFHPALQVCDQILALPDGEGRVLSAEVHASLRGMVRQTELSGSAFWRGFLNT